MTEKKQTGTHPFINKIENYADYEQLPTSKDVKRTIFNTFHPEKSNVNFENLDTLDSETRLNSYLKNEAVYKYNKSIIENKIKASYESTKMRNFSKNSRRKTQNSNSVFSKTIRRAKSKSKSRGKSGKLRKTLLKT